MEPTGSLEDKVGFHREVFLVDAVLTGGVEVELGQIVGLVVGYQRAIGQGNLETGAQVLELGAVGLGQIELEGARRSIVDGSAVNDNG